MKRKFSPEQLKLWINRNQLTLAQVGAKMGHKSGMPVGKYTRGDLVPSTAQVERLAAAVGCRVDDLWEPRTVRATPTPFEWPAGHVWDEQLVDEGVYRYGKETVETFNDRLAVLSEEEDELYRILANIQQERAAVHAKLNTMASGS